MKEKDLKKAYKNMKISETEKNKIFNNIMENKPRKKMIILPFMSLASVSLAIFLVIISNSSSINNYKKIKYNTENLSLIDSYKKEIIFNVNTYLSESYIDLDELELEEELNIDTKKIIDDEIYKICKGNLNIKRVGNGFIYSPDVECGDEVSNVSYRLYEFTHYQGFKNFGNRTLIISSDDSNDYHYSHDSNLTMYDEDGQILWTRELKRKNITDNTSIRIELFEETSYGYIAFIEYTSYSNIQEYDDGHQTAQGNVKYEVLTLDEKGNTIENNLNINNFSYLYNAGDNIICFEMNDKVYFLNKNTLEMNGYNAKIPGGTVIGFYDEYYYYQTGDYVTGEYYVKHDIKTGKDVAKIKLKPGQIVERMITKNGKIYAVLGYPKEYLPSSLVVYDDNLNELNCHINDDIFLLNYENGMFFRDDKLYITSSFEEVIISEYDLNGNFINNYLASEYLDVETNWDRLLTIIHFDNKLNVYSFGTNPENGMSQILLASITK